MVGVRLRGQDDVANRLDVFGLWQVDRLHPGAKPFEQFFCEAVLDPGDAVLVFSPHFPTYEPNIARRERSAWRVWIAFAEPVKKRQAMVWFTVQLALKAAWSSVFFLLERPGVGLIFFVPGLNETLRVNGRARITTDPALLEPLAVNGKVPRSGILVAAEEIYFHCGKALIRSDLWNPEKQLRKSEFPSLGRILADQIGGMSVEEAERTTAESYRTRLY